MDIILDGDLCLSGGAVGADITFGSYAIEAKHGLLHWSFDKHKVTQQKDYVVVLPDSELIQADPYLIKANEFVQRSFPTSSEYVNNLLRRNWFQVRDSSSCYAVSKIEKGCVDGGTAWATSLFLLKHEYNPCPCYVYCQITECWHEWSGASWKGIGAPPNPSDIYAGIGSRKLSTNGSEAISNLYKG